MRQFNNKKQGSRATSEWRSGQNRTARRVSRRNIRSALRPKIVAFALVLLASVFIVNAVRQSTAAPAANIQQGFPTVAGTEIGGLVFRDFNANGTLDPQEPGFTSVLNADSVTIQAYDNEGNLAGSADTQADGTFIITGLTAGEPYRLEMVGLPIYLEPGVAHTGDNPVSATSFASPGTGNVLIGVNDPNDFCQDINNTHLGIPCFVNGDPLAGGTAGPYESFVTLPWDANPETGVPPAANNSFDFVEIAATASQTGSTWGVAYDADRELLYTSSMIRRHAGLGPNGVGGIYAIDMSDPTAPTFDTGNDYTVTGLGADPHSGLGPDVIGPTFDTDAFDATGTQGIGDIDYDEDLQYLYVVDITNRQLVTLDLSNGLAAATQVSAIAIDDPCTGGTNGTGEFRPWALEVQDGVPYVGVTCTSSLDNFVQSTGPAAARTASIDAAFDRLRVHVMQLDGNGDTGTGFTSVYNRNPVNEDRGNRSVSAVGCNHFLPWYSDWTEADFTAAGLCGVNRQIDRRQPLLMDIEFDNDGSLFLGIGDRSSYQVSSDNRRPDPGGSTAANLGDESRGDMMRACWNPILGDWEDDGTASCTGNGNNNEYYDDRNVLLSGGSHQETFQGASESVPGYDEFAWVSMSPQRTNSGGIAWSNHASGDFSVGNDADGDRDITILDFLADAAVGKAAGLGDIEATCQAAPIELGNRVWRDLNGNGRQDPWVDLNHNGVYDGPEEDEAGMAGITVHLYDDTNTIVASAVTDNNGNYVFTNHGYDYEGTDGLFAWMSQDADGVIDHRGIVPGGISPYTDYTIRIDDQAGINGEPANIITDNGANGVQLHLADGSLLKGTKVNQFGAGIQGQDNTGDATGTAANFANQYDKSDNDGVLSGLGWDIPVSHLNKDGTTSATAGDNGENDHSFDFGFVEEYSIGDLVWEDSNDNGVFDTATESGIENVTMQLYRDVNGNGVLDIGTDVLVNTQQTDADGRYTFDSVDLGLSSSYSYDTAVDANSGQADAWDNEILIPGTYFVHIPAAEFAGAGDLNGAQQTTSDGTTNPPAGDPEDNNENVDHDTFYHSGSDYTNGATSGPIELNSYNAAGTEPDGDQATDGNDLRDNAAFNDIPDQNSQLNVDFAFLLGSGRIGNLVWYDTDNDGVADAGERTLSGVSVVLMRAATPGTPNPATDTVVDHQVTDGDGNYLFENVPFSPNGDSDYYVVIPGTGTTLFFDGDGDTNNDIGDNSAVSDGTNTINLNDIISSNDNGAGFQDTGEATDNNDNGSDTGATGIISLSPTLPLEAGAEPTTEVDAINGLDEAGADALDGTTGPVDDNSSNLTIDFGFYSPPDLAVNKLVDGDGDSVFGDSELLEVPGISGNPDPTPFQYQITVTNQSALTDGTGVELTDVIPPGVTIASVASVTTGSVTSGVGVTGAAGTGSPLVWDIGTATAGTTYTLVLNATLGSGDLAAFAAGFDLGASTQNVAEITDMNEIDIDSVVDNGDAADYGGATNGFDSTTSEDDEDDARVTIAPALGNFVWRDNDADGVQDAGEPGIGGVTVILWQDTDATPGPSAGDTQIASVPTMPDGSYWFGDLTAGVDYYVEFDHSTAPADVEPTAANAGGDDALDSDGDVTTGYSGIYNLDPGEIEPTVDMGYAPRPSLGDYVWFDENADGVQDAGENGIQGVDVNLYIDDDGTPGPSAGDTLVTTETTDNNGAYLFESLTAGVDYYVEFDHSTAPAGYTPTVQGAAADPLDANDSDGDVTTGFTEIHTLSPSEQRTSVDMGYHPLLSIGNLVWDDADNSGDVNGSEAGISGVRVELYVDTDGNGSYTPGTDVAVTQSGTNGGAGFSVTDGNGNWQFDNLPAGEYIAVIPSTQFDAGQPLEDYIVSTGTPGSTTGPNETAPDPDDDADNDDNGTLDGSGNYVSAAVSLAYASEPTDDGDTDAFSNLSVDFGVLIPYVDVELGKTLDMAAPHFVGQTVSYTITLTNQGPEIANNIVVNDATPANLTLVGAAGGSPSAGTWTAPDWTVPTLAPGDSETLTLEFTINAGTADDTIITNYTQVTAHDEEDIDSDPNDNAGPTPGTLEADPAKQTGTDTHDEEAAVSLTVSVLSLGNLVWHDSNNDGLVDGAEAGIPGVRVELYEDTNGNGTYDPGTDNAVTQSGTNGGAGFSVTDGAGNWLFTDLPAGEYIAVIPSSQFTAGQPLESYVSSTGTQGSTTGAYEPAPDPDNDTNNDDNGSTDGSSNVSSEAITLAYDAEPIDDGDADDDSNLSVDFGFNIPVADLALMKQIAAENQIVLVGDTVQFTITVTNQGAFDAYDVVISDYIPAGFELTAANAADWGGAATVGPATVSQTIAGPIAAGGGVETITIDLTVSSTAATGELTNEAEISEMRDSAGGAILADIDSTPDSTQGNDIGGQDDTDTDDHIDDDGADGDGDGITDEDDHDSEDVIVAQPDLALTKTIATEDQQVTVGDTVQFQIQVTNQGDIDAYDVVVSDYIPAGFELTAANATDWGGAAATGASTVTQTIPGPIASSGGVANLTIDLTVTSAAVAGDLTNTAEISEFRSAASGRILSDIDSTPDSIEGNDAGSRDDDATDNIISGDGTGAPGDGVAATDEDDADQEDVVVEFVDLAVTKLVDGNGDTAFTASELLAVPGQGLNSDPTTFQYQITVTNQNDFVTGTGVELTDVVPPGIRIVSYTATQGSVAGLPITGAAGTGSPLVWTVGTVAPLATHTLTLDAELDSGANSTTFIAGFDSGASSQNVAQITAMNETDLDSDPATNAGGDPDYGGATSGFNVGASEDDEDDARVTLPPALGDFVWQDTDADGVQDAGEPGIGGVRVVLWEDTDGDGVPSAGDTAVATVNTGSDGAYLFGDLTAGVDYYVEFDHSTAPNNLQPTSQDQGGADAADSDGDTTTGYTGIYTLAAGEYNDTVDMGYTLRPSLGNYVWEDTNGDGVQDAAESGIQDVTVNLYRDVNGNGVYDAGTDTLEDTQTTDSAGAYLFSNLDSGVPYIVEFDHSTAPTNLEPTTQGAAADPLDATDSDGDRTTGLTEAHTLVPAENRTSVDMGYRPRPTLGNYVWEDTNADGVQDAAESGIENVTVNLYQDVNGNGSYDAGTDTLIDTQSTGPNGEYLFENLDSGVPYIVEFDHSTAPTNLEPTTQGAAADPLDATDSDGDRTTGLTEAHTLDPVENRTSVDMGYAPRPSLGDFVWRDDNGNGTQDAGEPGIDGVTVTLRIDDDGTPGPSAGDGTVTSVNTTGGGMYLFDDLTSGVNYWVEFDHSTAPTGYNPTTQGAAADPLDATDSDGDTTDGWTELHNLSLAEDRTSVDMGYVPYFSIGNRIWLDNADGGGTFDDGVQNGGEAGIGSVTVNLLDSTGTTVASMPTDADGYYRFDNLLAGDYTVEVVASTLPAGVVSSTGQSTANTPDQSDHGSDTLNASSNYVSHTVTVGPTAGTQPTDESDIATGNGAESPHGDDHSNLAIDFGFVPYSDVGVTKTVAPDLYTVGVGGDVTFTVEVTNHGPNDATDITVADPVPTGLTFTSWTCAVTTAGTGGLTEACANASGSGAIAETVTLNTGGIATYTIVANIDTVQNATLTNTVDVALPSNLSQDPVNNQPDQATASVTPQGPDLALRKTLATGQSSSVALGDDVTFTLEVFNQGQVDAYNIDLIDYLPAGLTLSTNDTNGWVANGTNVTNTLPGPLVAGASTTISIVTTIDSSFAGDSLINTAEITEFEDAFGNVLGDIDSTPDSNPGDTTTDDEINDSGAADEDDSDIAGISIEALSETGQATYLPMIIGLVIAAAAISTSMVLRSRAGARQ